MLPEKTNISARVEITLKKKLLKTQPSPTRTHMNLEQN